MFVLHCLLTNDVIIVLRYESGDHVAVYPINDTAMVNKIGELLAVDLDTVISLNNLDGTTVTLTVGRRVQLKSALFNPPIYLFPQ